MDRDGDGTNDFRVEISRRGKQMVLQTFSSKTVSGEWITTARNYCVSGELILTEVDEDGDGFLEGLAIYNPATHQMEVFERKQDGTVTCVEAEVLLKHKEADAAVEDFWKK